MPSFLMAAALSSVVSWGAWGCRGKAGEHAPPPSPQPPREVHVARVKAGAGAPRAVPGTVRARDRASLSARMAASVVALPYREGEHVSAGAIVARLEDSALRATLAASEAAHTSAQADLQRAESLLARGASTPREVEQARSQAAAAAAAVQGARDQLAYAVLRAPIAGTVAARPAHVGDVVGPGMPVIEVERDHALEIQASIDASEARGLFVGQEMDAHVDGLPQPLHVRVRSLGRAADPSTHRFDLRAEAPAADGLRSGLFARLLLPARGAEGAPGATVPRRAVFTRGGLTGVWVVDGGVARLRWIAVGEPRGDDVEVRAGLKVGEAVALEPEGLGDGAPVRVR